MKPGTQIVYRPTGETGFVTTVGITSAFCRFWRTDGELRTKSTSELVPLEFIHEFNSVPQEKVDKWIKENCVNESLCPNCKPQRVDDLSRLRGTFRCPKCGVFWKRISRRKKAKKL